MERVHHKDHNHNNNPPDSGNWELPCLYGHDHEHEKTIDARYIDGSEASVTLESPGLATPFDNLPFLLEPEEDG